jgi:FkbM family methyltransferase
MASPTELKRGLAQLVRKHVLRSTGLNRLDRRVSTFLKQSQGVFVEAGANDGIEQSNTFILERYRGWRGLLVEPIPELAQACRRNRPHAIVECAALVPFSHVGSQVAMRSCGLMSTVKGAMASDAEELAHVREGARIQRLKVCELEVPAATLTSLLEKHAIRDVDFLSLDVEGYELSVLEGLDFDRYRPTFMLIEARYRAAIDRFVGPLYEPVAELSQHDVLYKRATSNG